MEDFIPAHRRTITTYELLFDDGHGNGWGFPCDANGNILPCDNPAAAENLKWCREHKENFVRADVIAAISSSCVEPAHGTCKCGEKINLTNEYMGACQCPACGQWYNLFGQELNDPETWNEGDDY